jgi:CBS domain-containing protein
VAEVMTESVATATEDMDLATAADRMDEHRVKRLPVVRDGRVGIVSRANMLQALVSRPEVGPVEALSDADLRRQILVRLDCEPWAQTIVRNIIVHDGNVDLWGHAETQAQCEAFGLLVREIQGVRSVTNNMVATPRGVYLL